MSVEFTLPGDLPGLLRFGSVVRDAQDCHRIGIVVGTGSSLGSRVFWCLREEVTWTSEVPVCLDLSDPTSRIHAIAWAEDQVGELTHKEERALHYILRHGFGPDYGTVELDREHIAILRNLCLRLAPAGKP